VICIHTRDPRRFDRVARLPRDLIRFGGYVDDHWAVLYPPDGRGWCPLVTYQGTREAAERALAPVVEALRNGDGKAALSAAEAVERMEREKVMSKVSFDETMPLPGVDSALRLVALRVELAGDGALRVKGDGRGGYVADAVLPGNGDILRFVKDGGRQTAQMFYPTGRALSVELDLDDPTQFASLMHNVDVEILRTDSGATEFDSARLPPEALELIDAAVMADPLAEPGLAAAVRGLWRDGAERDLAATGAAALRAADVGPLVAAAEASFDPAIRAAAARVSAVAFGRAAPRKFDDLWSLIRWHDQVDRWLLAAAGVAAESVPAGEGKEWVRLFTDSSLVAEARSIGRLEGELRERLNEPRGKGDLMAEVRKAGGIKAWMETLRAARPAFLADDGRSVWSLRDLETGERRAVAVVRDGEAVVAGPPGLRGDPFVEYFDELMELKAHLGGAAAPSPR
jgi:hypothetical protein